MLLFSLQVKILSTSVYSMQKCRDVKTWDRSSPAPDKKSVISIGNKTTWVRLQRSLSLPSFIFPAHSIQTWLLCESALKRTIETLAVNWNFCRNLFILIKKTLRPASWQLAQPCVFLLFKVIAAILGFTVSWLYPRIPYDSIGQLSSFQIGSLWLLAAYTWGICISPIICAAGGRAWPCHKIRSNWKLLNGAA